MAKGVVRKASGNKKPLTPKAGLKPGTRYACGGKLRGKKCK